MTPRTIPTNELDHLELGTPVAEALAVTSETFPLVYGIVSKALGLDHLPPGVIPGDATFTLRRDVEYLPDVFNNGYSPTYAAPNGIGGIYPKVLRDLNPLFDPEQGDPDRGYGWIMSGEQEEDPETGELDPIESEWCGSDQYVYAFRWDWHGVTIPELEDLARQNDWEGDYAETMMGYLDADGIRPSVSFNLDGTDWNQGGVTPVFIAEDYVVLD